MKLYETCCESVAFGYFNRNQKLNINVAGLMNQKCSSQKRFVGSPIQG
ncbi:hypothetical protein [Vibrio gallaecicus]|nr:hypothetical protein [Vibrio gallaecicus]MDN3613680.1 hypothetical protein [Vibrio gallaecicus]